MTSLEKNAGQMTVKISECTGFMVDAMAISSRDSTQYCTSGTIVCIII